MARSGKNTNFERIYVLLGNDPNHWYGVENSYGLMAIILLYAAEAWIINKNDNENRVIWTMDLSKDSHNIVNGAYNEYKLFSQSKKGKLKYLGNIMREFKYQLLQLVLQGKIEGKIYLGRRRTSWLKSLREWFHCTSLDLFREAVSTIRIDVMIANFQIKETN